MKASEKTVSVVDTNERICSLFGMEIAGGVGSPKKIA